MAAGDLSGNHLIEKKTGTICVIDRYPSVEDCFLLFTVATHFARSNRVVMSAQNQFWSLDSCFSRIDVNPMSGLDVVSWFSRNIFVLFIDNFG